MREFLEDQIRGSRHRLISVAGSRAGFASIHQGHLIRDRARELFGNIAERIRRLELFSTDRAGECVGFGILAPSEYRPGVASIGMITKTRLSRLDY